jgi:hypothetical protein
MILNFMDPPLLYRWPSPPISHLKATIGGSLDVGEEAA